tara:strand:+ start:973 stop:1143 length:171 start_codon:yes stop_codon:yes gene_type:complete
MTNNEKYFIKALLEVEMEGISIEKKGKVMEALYSNKITFENFQACINKIAKWQRLK